MIRELVVAALTAGAAISTVPAASADPPHYDTDVPNMAEGVISDEACFSTERYIYGHGPNGQAMACHFIPNQFPEPSRGTPTPGGYWMISYPLYGVKDIGSPCPNPQSAAQSPDGLPLLCLGARGWQPGIYIGGAGPRGDPGFIPFPRND
jgi:hypothetical protein